VPLFLRFLDPLLHRAVPDVETNLPLTPTAGTVQDGGLRSRASLTKKGAHRLTRVKRQRKKRCDRNTSESPTCQPCYHCLIAGVVKMIDRRPKMKTHSGPKGLSGTEPEAVRVKLLGILLVSGGFGTLRSA